MNLKTYKKIIFHSLFALLLISPILTFAQSNGGTNNTSGGSSGSTGNTVNATLQNPLKVDSIYDLFFDPTSGIINIILKFAYVVVAFMIIWGGFKLIKAQGKEKELTDAKRSLTWTLIGAAIVIGANVIASVLNSTIQQFTN